MGPAVAKKEKAPTVPTFIDDAFIKTLSKEKQDYWANRKLGKRGNPTLIPKAKVFSTPQDIAMGFDNDGHMVAKTRAVRRKRKPVPVIYTKATHSIKKARNKK